MTVEIRVGGDVIIYDKDCNWNFVFITDGEHPVKFFVGGTELASLRTPGRRRRLRIEIPEGKREWGSDREKIFNMGHDELHGYTGANSNLEVMNPPKSPADRETVRLLVPVGTVKGTPMGVGGDAWYPDYRFRPYPDGTEDLIDHETAKYATLTFEVNGPLRLLEGRSTVYESLYTPGKTLEIVLDNDCLGQGHPDDFLMYYDWVRDSTDPSKFFTARKPGPGMTVMAILSPQGNCDPTRIDPPPFP